MSSQNNYYRKLAAADRALKEEYLQKDLDRAFEDFRSFCWGEDGVCKRYGADFLNKMTSQERYQFDTKLDRKNYAQTGLRNFQQFKE